MALTDTDLGNILVAQNYLAQQELESALADAAKLHVSLVSILTERGLISDQLLCNALAEHYQLPLVDLLGHPPEQDVLELLPETTARQLQAVVLERTEDGLRVVVADPQLPNLESELRRALGLAAAKDEEEIAKPKTKANIAYTGTLTMGFAPASHIERILHRYRKPLTTRFQQILKSQQAVAPEILLEIIDEASELRASDIHFEPQGATTVIRFRVDGVMHEAGRMPKQIYEGVLNRMKISANMRIDQHFIPQDGAIRHRHNNAVMDIRVSIIPVVDGEKAVLRLLSAYVRTLTLQSLGFSERHQHILEQAAHKPYGMVITTGPTGSGKSTTLYALVKLRNAPDVNISTIEDPVEYKVPGVNHIQVNEATGLTFASGLRSLVRQDPDIVLVGEIRDGETADIAVNAALTGHLLLSTLHSNDAATAIPRLLDMGVEPFLLASTLEVIAGQRLVRTICTQCRTSYAVGKDDIAALFPGAVELLKNEQRLTLYRGKGCDACSGTGYRGRTGIHELLEITTVIEELIVARASSTDIARAARKQGMQTMFEDGLQKVRAGITTIEELLRVAAPPSAQQ